MGGAKCYIDACYEWNRVQPNEIECNPIESSRTRFRVSAPQMSELTNHSGGDLSLGRRQRPD
jgi:hypothetical protein